jgi:hypothetical protein
MKHRKFIESIGMKRTRKTAMISGNFRVVAFALAAGLMMTGWAGAQTPALASSPGAPAYKLVIEPRAIELLKETSARLAAAKSMSFTAVVSYEFPSKLGPPLVYTVRNDVTMERPDKLKVITPGDGPSSEVYYNGKTVMAYVPDKDLVAIADAPPTIGAALQAAYDNAAIYYPFSDLIVTDPYRGLTEGTILAFYIGQSDVVGGVKTDMVAWASNDVFLQIWIGVDDKLPHRIRAIYHDDPLQQRHDMVLSNWQIDPVLPPNTFTSEAALSAKRIPFGSPLGEPLPPGKPLFITPPAKIPPAATQSKP